MQKISKLTHLCAVIPVIELTPISDRTHPNILKWDSFTFSMSKNAKYLVFHVHRGEEKIILKDQA